MTLVIPEFRSSPAAISRSAMRHAFSTGNPNAPVLTEVQRVLAPGGRFYALTPAYPAAEAFADPTHVNIVTEQTHTYFCGEEPLGRMYGFNGSFRALDVRRVYRPPPPFRRER